MKFSSIHKQAILKSKMFVDTKSTIIILPDTGIQTWRYFASPDFLLSNCSGIIAPSTPLTVGHKLVNTKTHYMSLRKKMSDAEVQRKLKVTNNFPIDQRSSQIRVKDGVMKDKSNFYFYDATSYAKAIESASTRIKGKNLALLLVNQLSDIYKKIKQHDPLMNIDIVIPAKSEEGMLINLISDFKKLGLDKDLSTAEIFDNYLFLSNNNDPIMPVMFKDNGKTKVIQRNITTFRKYLAKNDEAKEKEEEINTQQVIDDTPVAAKFIGDEKSPLKQIAQSIVQKDVKATVEGDKINIELDAAALRKILKVHKITDPDILANVKAALDHYVEITKQKPTKETAELIVMKAIHLTLFGTDDVDAEYLTKPALLIRKLSQVSTHKVPLNFPKMNEYVVSPEDFIDIKHTTGQFRQKFEFEKTIHEYVGKLFSSIETVNEYPIKIRNVKWEVKDDGKSRFTEYIVTLKNLAGGREEQYPVKLRVPAPVNDRYFKLGGNNYIMSTQQFLKVLTKTAKQEVRILTSYTTVTVRIRNLKFNPADLDDIISYIKVRYANLIKEETDEFVKFSDASTIYKAGSRIYEAGNLDIQIDPENNKLTNMKTGDIIPFRRYEYIYQTILEKIKTANPDDRLTKSKKSIPYLEVYMGGIDHLPLIMYLWSQKGLLDTLNEFGIDYEITDKLTTGSKVYVTKQDGKNLVIKPKGIRQELLCNGLLYKPIKYKIHNLNDKKEVADHIIQNFGQKSVFHIGNITENEIDPVTRELLEFENLPTNLPGLITGPVIDMLLNQAPDSLSDLKIYRTRLSEYVLQAMYSQIKMAHAGYKTKLQLGDENAKIELDPNYVINDMLGGTGENMNSSGMLQQTEPVSPVEEIMLASRVIKQGKGGVPTKRAITVEHRNLHESQKGTIGANSTPESATVGMINHHTLTPSIINKYGSYGMKDISTMSGWNMLSLDEAMIPMVNEVDSGRLTMSVQHSKQITPVNNAEAPLIRSGAEFIVPQLASTRFAHKAQKDGKVIEVNKDKNLTVRYRDGKTEVFDIIPRLSRTKRGAYISLSMNTLKEGDKFKANQVIASTKNFDNDGVYQSGKNVTIAMLNYEGYGHEDAYVISQNLADETTTDVVQEVDIPIPPETKIINIEKKLKTVENGEVLVEFTYEDDLDTFVDLEGITQEEGTEEDILSVYSKGRDTIKLLATEGEIIDIKMYINNRNLVDKALLNFHAALVRDRKQLINKLETSIENESQRKKATDNMDNAFMEMGGHRRKGIEFRGARIVYYIKKPKQLNEGDKIANRYGAKGVIGKILKEAPRAAKMGDIQVMISPIGVFARKNTA